MDIVKKAILRGDNSEIRKLLNAVPGGENSAVLERLGFLDPSTRGASSGHNSVPHVLGRQIDQTLNPFRWKL